MLTVGPSMPCELSNGGTYQVYTASPELQVVGGAFQRCVKVFFHGGTDSHEGTPVISPPLNAVGRTRVPNPPREDASGAS